MSSLLSLQDEKAEALARLARRRLDKRAALVHPAGLLRHVKCVDATAGETFTFQLDEPGDGWYWQRELLDAWRGNSKYAVLKARQLGITWLAAAYALWHLLCIPGTKVLVVSINEAEAIKVVNRIWDMLDTLPEHLKFGVQILKPVKARPNKEIQLKHPDGRISTVIGLPSTPYAGHGEVAALVILDEFSRQEYAAETWKAVLPTTQGGGKVLVISTGNGVSNDRGGGNYFHHLWTSADEYGIQKRFLPWNLNPSRDETWYRAHAMALPTADRGEQYPRNEHEAFILTGRPYFDIDALLEYEALVPEPLYRMDFELVQPDKARKKVWDQGYIRIYAEPSAGARYAIGADVATGRGYDYSAAYVVDLSTMALVAEFHGKLDADLYATQLHYLGRYYNTALLAVETGGGYGDAITIPLRDGRAGRPAYPRLYKHIMSNRPTLDIAKPFGFPMSTKTRPLVINQLEKAIRERAIPFLTRRLLDECRTFVHADTNPTPRAQEGTNDDAVMACAITLEMYRLRGSHPARDQRRRRNRRERDYDTFYPWQLSDNSREQAELDRRYPREASVA